jgi:hypothetical protein
VQHSGLKRIFAGRQSARFFGRRELRPAPSGSVRDRAGRHDLPGLDRLAFRVVFHGRSLQVQFDRENAIYELREGDPLQITHHGQTVEVSGDEPVTLAIPDVVPRGNPTQPAGRTPARRRLIRQSARRHVEVKVAGAGGPGDLGSAVPTAL